jgi:hypothetical protein
MAMEPEQQQQLVLEEIRRAIARANADLAKWKGTFEENPVYAFEWAVGAFEAAANLELLGHLEAYIDRPLDGPETFEQRLASVAGNVDDEVQRMARGPSRSSSSAHNLMDECKLKARAEWSEMLDHLQYRIQRDPD